jgi:hypothetical protein
MGCPFIETDTKENGKGQVQSDKNVNSSIAIIKPADTDIAAMTKLHVWFVDFSAAVSPAN